jgi:outer membrane lipoprotein-sorting protein
MLAVAVALIAVVLALGSSSTQSLPAPGALDAFADAWSKIDAYSATLATHETAANSVQDRTYAFSFRKPSDATIVVTGGPGRGGKVVWSGGDSVIGSPAGLLSGMKVQLAIKDPRVTSLRGDTVAMASFAWILDHFRQTAGVETQAPSDLVNGNTTTAISLAVADPAADDGLTQEVLVLQDSTKLPVSIRRYAGAQLVKEVHFDDVVVQQAETSSHNDSATAAAAR